MFSNLLNKEKYLNCKFKVTRESEGLKKSMNYKVVNGKFKDAFGNIYPLDFRIKTPDDLRKYFRSLEEIKKDLAVKDEEKIYYYSKEGVGFELV